jgi:class 3 adenylate cyclase/tetratricopeptide (TPR) repeat protein
MAVCTQCGRQNADDARFCSGCAAPLVAEPTAPRAVRKTVTLVFCDMVDSTPLGERLDSESLRRVLARWHQSMRTALERYGGTVEKFVGDAVMAVFGLPVAHEDDALRATRAAADMRVALAAINAELEREYGVEIKVRTAVHTGDVVAGDGETLVTGDAVNVAARLEQNAKAGEILLGEQTAHLLGEAALVEPVPELALKGKAQPVSAWRLVSVLPDVPAFTRPIATPFVGRRGELAALEAAFERAAVGPRCELVTVLGAPGIGKSRLMREAVASVGERARVLIGRCLPYGEGITYWPLIEIVKQIAGQEPQSRIAELVRGDESAELVAELVAAAVGASERGGSTDETHWAIRTLLEAVARDHPLVVVLEDLHWAEPTFLDLVEYIAGFSRGRPILLLGSARPELLETRPTWATPGPNAELLLLEPLTKPEVEALVDALLEARALPEHLRARVLEAAEGNPLFVEQLLALQAEDGGADGELAVPPTLRALLAARIDRLEPAERAVLERAAVEGRGFHRGAIAELLPTGERAAVGACLLALVRKELIRPDRSEFPGDDGFRFAHMLIRDSAYDSTPKELRAELHVRYAYWLEAKVGDRIREYEEILGYHLEQACRHRRELAPADEQTLALARQAAALLASAGRRALARADAPAAAALLSRAVALLPEGDADGRRLLPDLGRALYLCGDFGGGIGVLDEAIERAEAAGDRRTRSYALLLRGDARTNIEPEFTAEEALSEAMQVLRVFEELGDERGQARAWISLASSHATRGQYAEARNALKRALAHATAAGDEPLEARVRLSITLFLLRGAAPLDEVVPYAQSLLDQVEAKGGLGLPLLAHLGQAHAMRGQFELARRLIAEHVAALEDLGNRFAAAVVAAQRFGVVEMLAGDPAAAERHLRPGYGALEEAGDTGYLSSVAAVLANAVYAQGRDEEAERYTRISEETAARDDYFSQILWRSVRAKAFARKGRLADGEQLAREAVTLAEATDDIDLHGDALMALADVLCLAERPGEALPVIKEALRLYEQKGSVVSADKARSLLGELPGTSTQ